ncbi:VOC family protein [Oleiagrimonas sp.]|jgi:glyoxylase I family protein|uniref:VOC family protein n=1 Tax=Oleiagrimonas sp. TaxID=2010330 RepID=UPI0026202F74|nr:VOC family protein [Oleiagrimonas sp.]MDA3914329.1 VOC family protein [Oleiagrimonas sp.]
MPFAPFKIAQIDHVVLRVSDMDRLQRFYCEVLGCTVERWQEDLGLLQLRAGSSLIDLVDVAGPIGRKGGVAPSEQGHNMDHVCLRVEPFDAEAITTYLKTREVRIGESGMRYGAQGTGPSLYLFDPEGNRVELKAPVTAGADRLRA